MYYEDIEGKGYLTTCRIGPYMKSPLRILSRETAEVLQKYRTQEFDWRIRFYENVSLRDTSKKD